MPAPITPISEHSYDQILSRMGHDPCDGVEIEFQVEVAPATPDSPKLQATLFRPESRSAAPAPALVAFHGGGFCVGDPNGMGDIAKALALSLGVTTVSLSYRLGTATSPVYPGILHDGATGWRWVHRNAAKLGIDPKRIAVAGSSAGCLLAGHLAVRSPQVAAIVEGTPAPAALISLWGPLDFVARWYDNGECPGAEENLFGPGGYAKFPHLYHQASVLAHAGAGPLQPALFVYGRRDTVVHPRQGHLGLAAWQAAGAHAELCILDNIGHGVVGDNRERIRQVLEKVIAFSAWRWVESR
jgi:acetyl esterase/lipase